jgi:hypothetical protein
MCDIRVLMPFAQGPYSNRDKGVTVPEEARREEIIDALAGVMGDPHFAKAAKEHFYMRCNGQVIDGDTTLRDVGGREGSSVTCTLSLRGGAPCVGKRGPTATDTERQEPDSKRGCRLTSDILATLDEEHIEDCDAGSADDVADGCEPDHADADHAGDADHACAADPADADHACASDPADADHAAHIHWHTPPQCGAHPPTHTHAHAHPSQPVDGHAGTTAVKRSLRPCRVQPQVLCDAESESEPEDSTPKVCRLTAHGSPRTQPRTNGF